MPRRWVVFDYGEVISKRTGALPDLARTLGAATEAFEPAYWAERDAYDRGLPDTEYWRAVGARVGRKVDDATASRLTELDTHGWLRLDSDTVTLIDHLSAAGVPLALLSNAPSSFGRLVEGQSWSARFEHLMFSGDLGVAKPDGKIWAALLDRLAASPSDCVFLDDRKINVDGAIAAGLRGLLWTDAPSARARLVDFGLLGP